MPVKLIATDLDGTLMAPDHMTVTERTKAALLSAHNKGIKIAIATGRTLVITKAVTDQLPFVDYVIYSNGAAVYDRKAGCAIYEDQMPWTMANRIISFLEAYPVCYEVYAGGRSHMRRDKMDYLALKDIPAAFIEELSKDVVLHEDLLAEMQGLEVEKINLFNLPAGHDTEIRAFLETIPQLHLTSAIADDIEITFGSADKGKALAGMCAALQIAPKDVMSFGDAGNDVGMLRFAGWSFAMANARPDAKAAAKYETQSNAQDGLAAAVEKYVLGEADEA